MNKCITILSTVNNTDIFLHNLSEFNFFIRSNVKIFLEATCKEFRDRSESGMFKYTLTEYNTTFNMIGLKSVSDCVIIITTEQPPHDHLVCLAYAIKKNGLKESISENFNYIQNNVRIKQIEKEISDIKLVMTDNIEKIMNRGEKLEDLLQKTKYLEEDSRRMLDSAKKLNNRCCNIL